MQSVLIKSDIVAEDLKDTHISCEHLLLALIKYDAEVQQFLATFGITYEEVQKRIAVIRSNQKLVDNDEYNWNEIVKDLSEIAIDITAQAAQ